MEREASASRLSHGALPREADASRSTGRKPYTKPTAAVVGNIQPCVFAGSHDPGRYNDLDPQNVPIKVEPGSSFDAASGHGHSSDGSGNRAKPTWGDWGYWDED